VKRHRIEGVLLSVNCKSLIRKKKVYEKNGRLVLSGLYAPNPQNKMFMSMVLIGALNVGRIIARDCEEFPRGCEMGYFNLGSTIIMIFEAPNV
jgi:phosphatidylserine decarboxylase